LIGGPLRQTQIRPSCAFRSRPTPDKELAEEQPETTAYPKKMQDASRSYKFSCRKCSIRLRCIEDKGFGPGMKMTIARRFENRTDTFETWDMLQQDCLLVRYEKQKAERNEQREGSLVRRLREAREIQEAQPVKLDPAPSQHETIQRPPLPVVPAQQKPPATGPMLTQAASVPAVPCGFTLAPGDRMVRLPDSGSLVFGRFEHGFSNPPDIDLTYEDGEIPSVSRRHATVISRAGAHWIEDMGSINGTYVNGHQLPLGKSAQLSPNDRVLLGRCRLVYTPLPDWMIEPDPREEHVASLLVTNINHRVTLPDKRHLWLGRPDPTLGYVPDVDLSMAGDIAMYVSRRHARLILRSGWHFLEEVGSAAGTRLNGTPIHVGEQPVMLHPGDHIWLGGCVLAYEWELH
jgi:pSer/pThr/pTyr-binding forkhead associated (FHA) protein